MKYFFYFPENRLDRRADDVRQWIEFWRGEVVSRLPEEADMIVVAGGDGTMLSAIREFQYLGKPFFGIGRGTKNFLLNMIKTPNAIPRDFSECLPITLSLMKAVFQTPDGAVERFAFNDVYVKAAQHNSVARMHIRTERDGQYDAAGDGIVIATVQGSTAYNKNAYGPILPLEQQNLWTFIGICTEERLRHVCTAQRIHMEFEHAVVGVADDEMIPEVCALDVTPSDRTVTILFRHDEPFRERRRQS